MADPEERIAVFGADEQSDHAIDVLRWVELARLVVAEERVPGEVELSVLFVDPVAMADLNERFLGGPGPTDVLAFPIDEEPAPGGRQPDTGGRGPGATSDAADPPMLLGDVVVCPAIAAAQAVQGGRALDDELALLVVHGVLHLLGYDHAEADEAAAMQRREQELLARFGAGAVPAPASPDQEGA